jgi:putative endopeptidase
MRKLWIPGIAGMLLLAHCEPSGKEKDSQILEGIFRANMDTTVNPAMDFYKYANGKWLARTSIPADRGSWGSGSEVTEANKIILRKVLNPDSDKQYPPGSDQRKATDFYACGMDSLMAERIGAAIVKPWLSRIDALKGRADIAKFLVDQRRYGMNSFFGVEVEPDMKKSDLMMTYLVAQGIGLPDRDYYLKNDPKSKETRDKYKEHIGKIFGLIGSSPSASKAGAEAVLKLETQLARATMTKEEHRQPEKMYHRMALGEISKLSPSIDWKPFFSSLGIKEDTVIVMEPLFQQETERIIAYGSMDEIKAYLKFTVVRFAAPYLNHAFVQESFNFNSQYMRGVEKLSPRWKRVMDFTDNYVGQAVGKLYVAEAFPPEAKQKALEMVGDLKLAMADRIKNLDWMSDTTKQRALQKLSKFTVKIGYPDKWPDYTNLEVSRDPEKGSFFQNVLNAQRFRMEKEIAKLGKPVDRSEWGMTPQTVNAYYNPQFNEIVFPAGILQPPYYNFKADAAVNYGGIGAVIGHEISHGFDDEGSQFDPEGNLNNWWLKSDLEKFSEKGKAYAAQFSKYEPLPGLFVQGQFTLGENIGDLGGTAIALEGLQRYFREKGKPGPIDGLTQEQRFFLSWATVWRAKYKDEFLRTMVLSNPHSPAMYRATGPLSNMVEFYKAFQAKPGDPMYRDEKDRVKIW